MTLKVAALYLFTGLPDYADLREPTRVKAQACGLRGTLLLAAEGVNGTLAGPASGIDTFIDWLRSDALWAGRLAGLEPKYSTAQDMPFGKLKIRLKREIVTLKQAHVDPLAQVGTYVAPKDWNELISRDDVVVLDTRNAFEVAYGTFEGAIDPKTKSFGELPAFIEKNLDPKRHKSIAMFCTGGIRCEKASSYMLSLGFENVFHLQGGILKYLEEVPEAESLWRGSCFVFDGREALGHGLTEIGRTEPAADVTTVETSAR